MTYLRTHLHSITEYTTHNMLVLTLTAQCLAWVNTVDPLSNLPCVTFYLIQQCHILSTRSRKIQVAHSITNIVTSYAIMSVMIINTPV